VLAAPREHRLPEEEGDDQPKRKAFKRYPVDYVHMDIAEVRTEAERAPQDASRLGAVRVFVCQE